MKTTQTAKGDLLAGIQIDINKADYAEDVKKELKNYQHKASLPGFRQGKVPFGMIEKMYGSAVTFDKLNKKVSEALNNHIIENKLDVMGYPLSDPDKQQPTDPETQETMSFFFEVGLKPEIKVELGKIAMNDYNIKASDKEIDETIKRIQEGNKKDDKLPELNEELFKMIFPGKDIKDVETFRKEIATEMERQYVVEAERMFLNNAIDKLVSEVKFDMPDAFLKRWIVANSEGKISEEDVEKNYDNVYSKTFRWQLIEETIAKANPELVLKEEELREFVTKMYFGNLDLAGMDDDMKKRLDGIVDSVLKDENQRENIKNQVADNKVTAFLKKAMKVKVVDTDYEGFVKAVLPQEDKKPAAKKTTKKAAEKAEDKKENVEKEEKAPAKKTAAKKTTKKAE
jgi:FKBP-type peptidyl-prolyl cis-trans isomerase (trigger factor)